MIHGAVSTASKRAVEWALTDGGVVIDSAFRRLGNNELDQRKPKRVIVVCQPGI
jgi:hypothetical protein